MTKLLLILSLFFFTNLNAPNEAVIGLDSTHQIIRGFDADTVTFDASHLTNGIYFYTLKTGAFSAIKKMVVAK